MNFLDKQNKIVNFVKNNLSPYLCGLPELKDTDFVFNFLDFDKYKQDNVVFFSFPQIDFEYFSTDSNQQTISMNLFVKCTNASTDILKERCAMYASAIYNFFTDDGSSNYTDGTPIETPCDNNFGGLVDSGIIKNVSFYDATDGNPNIKVCELAFSLACDDTTED